MALDKLVDSTQLDSDLTSVANAIRTKGGTSASLAFPAGFVSAIGDIQTGGGGGLSFDWATVTTVTIGANSVTSTQGAVDYFSGCTYTFLILASELTVNNQLVCIPINGTLNQNGAFRWRGGAVMATAIGTNYDAKLVEGTQYYLLS